MLTRLRSPPLIPRMETSPTRVSLHRESPSAKITLSTCAAFCSTVKLLGNRSLAMYISVSHTVRVGNSWSSWWTKPMKPFILQRDGPSL